MSDYFLVGSYRHVPERSEYIGVIVKQQGKTMEVVTVGCETTEMDILTWIRESVKIMRDAGRTDVQAPDMYDRANLTFKN